MLPSFILAMRAAGSVSDCQSALDSVLFLRARSKRISSAVVGVSMPLARARRRSISW
jgi:hypothetical protein